MKQIISVLLLLTIVNSTKAFRLVSGNNVVISKPVFENLYIAGGTVTINAPVYGDLVIAGGNITINDTVKNDLLLAGGTATINGYVGDDVRSIGGRIYVGKGVGGELVISGGKIETGNESFVNNGIVAAGGDMVINGRIKGNITAYGGTVALYGTAEKAVDIRGGEIAINGIVFGESVLAAGNISIGNNASLNNNVRYWNRGRKLDFGNTLKNGNAVYDPTLKVNTGEWYFLGFAGVVGLLWYLGMALLMIALVQYLFSLNMRKAANTVFNTPGKSFGYGLLFFVGVPVAMILLMLSVIGIPVAFLLMFTYVTLILLASVITSVVASNWFDNRYKYNWKYKRLVLTAFGLFILLKIVSSTPFFGPVVMLALVCISFGAILLNINWKRPQPNKAVPSVPKEPLEYAV